MNHLGTRREKSWRMPTQAYSLSKPLWASATWTTTEAVWRGSGGACSSGVILAGILRTKGSLQHGGTFRALEVFDQ